MGGLLRASKPTAVAVAQAAPVVVVATPVVSAAAEQTTGAAREEARTSVRRGLAGTIATTDRGVLGMVPALPTATRKTLLGQ